MELRTAAHSPEVVLRCKSLKLSTCSLEAHGISRVANSWRMAELSAPHSKRSNVTNPCAARSLPACACSLLHLSKSTKQGLNKPRPANIRFPNEQKMCIDFWGAHSRREIVPRAAGNHSSECYKNSLPQLSCWRFAHWPLVPVRDRPRSSFVLSIQGSSEPSQGESYGQMAT